MRSRFSNHPYTCDDFQMHHMIQSLYVFCREIDKRTKFEYKYDSKDYFIPNKKIKWHKYEYFRNKINKLL